ncbi:MAG: phospho-N-acetylmuramoyl-pentapeptide-transferase [Pirellulales bacterium]|nr:phospho-N-acetylmuramoyl-pentapeptide-transferase [Pirellulales bacterium]
MLVWWLRSLGDSFGSDSLAAVGKITFRGALAAGVALAVALFLGPRLIDWLRRRFREPNKSDSPQLRQLHQTKQSTPTMGGLFLVAGVLGALVLLADLANPFVQIALFLTVGLGLVGVVDDAVKLRGKANGISARAKLLGQLAVASVAAWWLYAHHAAQASTGSELGALALWIPLADVAVPIGWGFVPLAIVVIVGMSNAVNLTDGLDGLAGGCLLMSIGAMGAVAYAAGHARIADYLTMARIPGAGEMAVLAAAIAGGVLGFLWFNCHPAQVFMGDTGSLPLGGLLGLIALACRQEALLLVVGGVFLAEAASVVVQVGGYKWRRRRVFRCAPLHHHFQFKGLPEGKIVVRFWIASAVCGILGLACLKVNISECYPAAAATRAETAVASPEAKTNLHRATYQDSVRPCEYVTDVDFPPATKNR